MTFWAVCILLVLGAVIGTISGMVGIGGGVIVIPLLILLMGFSQEKATGTSLAMLLPPIGLFAVITYAKAGNIDWRVAGLLALGFLLGGLLGGWLVNARVIQPIVLRIGLALFLIYFAGSLLFRSGGRARAALEACLLVAAFALVYVVLRLLGRHWMRMPGGRELYLRRRAQSGSGDYQI
ncbi:MAG: TSUP family transporter [Phycisphaerae bacterium]